MIELIITKDRYHLQEEIIRWCRENFGDGGWFGQDKDWYVQSGFGNTHFYFKNENDATMFTLRWVL